VEEITTALSRVRSFFVIARNSSFTYKGEAIDVKQVGRMTTDWVADGEKYALIGLEVKIEEAIPFRELTPGLWAWTDLALDVPTEWREWLGSIRTDEIKNFNLALLSKLVSKALDALDGENQLLERRAWGFYVGLLLSSTFTPSHPPIFLTGARRDGHIDVRQTSTIDIPSLNLFRFYPPILSHEVEEAAVLGQLHETLNTTPPAGGAERIFRALSVYVQGRSAMRLLDRLHQYCRCIDGLLLSEPGKGMKQFKSRTELFIGPGHHDLMGKLYGIRSDVEHLHEHKYLETFKRAERLELVEKEAIAEHVARKALAHVLRTPHLWPRFGNTDGLRTFWKLDPTDRQKLWAAPPFNPADGLAGFDPKYISDSSLGA
jgi:hypothetical protein